MIPEVDNLTSTVTTWPNTKLRKSWIVPWKTIAEREERESRSGKRTQAVIYESFMFQIPFRTRSS